MDLTIKIFVFASILALALGKEDLDLLTKFCIGKPTGNYPHPTNCGAFMTCIGFYNSKNPHAGRVLVQYCPGGLFYDPKIKVCNWPRNVECFKYQGHVCYGAKGDHFGEFGVSNTGQLRGIKLVHYDGYLTCNKRRDFESNWGCYAPRLRKLINTYITSSKDADEILFPESGRSSRRLGYYKLPGFSPRDDYIIWRASAKYYNLMVYQGEKLRVWYGEDLFNVGERNNDGKHCVDVFFLYSYYYPYYYSDHIMK